MRLSLCLNAFFERNALRHFELSKCVYELPETPTCENAFLPQMASEMGAELKVSRYLKIAILLDRRARRSIIGGACGRAMERGGDRWHDRFGELVG